MSNKIQTSHCVKEVFEQIKSKCNPKNSFDYLMKMVFEEKENNFSGGCGDIRTTHEKIFGLLFPNLKRQVSFGTGKGGYEKYGFKRVVVDFYDKEKNIAYEIDGLNHKRNMQKLNDKIKELFLYEKYKVKTFRITNQEVENLLLNRLKEMEKEGVLNCLYQ